MRDKFSFRIGSIPMCAALMALSGCGSSPGPIPPQAAHATATTPAPVATMPQAPASAPAACPDEADWNTPAEPRKIFGNTWFVGTCGISAVLVAGREGHILIDGATEQAGPMIVRNLRTLGVRPEDVRLLLISHEHLDHAGGLAALQAATGAPVLARAAALPTLARGASDRSDPQFLALKPFPPVNALRKIDDDETIRLGALALKTHATPGHTAGSTSWTWTSCEDTAESGRECRQMAYVDSLTAMSDDRYAFSDEAAHPGVLASFRASLDRVAALPCEILITPHPGASALWARLPPNATVALAQADACRDYAARARSALDERIESETRASDTRTSAR